MAKKEKCPESVVDVMHLSLCKDGGERRRGDDAQSDGYLEAGLDDQNEHHGTGRLPN